MSVYKEQAWFKEWFNSPYYHILYQHRDAREVEQFIDYLFDTLELRPGMKVLDLGCGRGRHAIYLHQKGLNVTGIDLSPKNIEYAKQFEQESLSFHVHDMREIFQKGQFDIVFNLFTSFGYFESEEDDIRVLKTAEAALKPGGSLLLDYMNVNKQITWLVAKEEKQIDGIHFQIKRFVENKSIIKEITVEEKGEKKLFREKVKALTLQDFYRLFSKTDLHIRSLFGNYNLEPYSKESSDRLILLAEKK